MEALGYSSKWEQSWEVRFSLCLYFSFHDNVVSSCPDVSFSVSCETTKYVGKCNLYLLQANAICIYSRTRNLGLNIESVSWIYIDLLRDLTLLKWLYISGALKVLYCHITRPLQYPTWWIERNEVCTETRNTRSLTSVVFLFLWTKLWEII